MKHQNPWDKSLLQKHREILKHYKKFCSFKKYNFWKEEITKLEQNLNSRGLLGNMDGKKQEDKSNPDIISVVNGQRWENHFKNLFTKHEGNIEDIMTINKTKVNKELNKTFSMTELQTAISKLKNNKAVGPDRIPNEFIKHVTNEIK